MSAQYARPFSRRRFLGRVTLAGTAGLLGLSIGRVAAEPPPETTRLRLVRRSPLCVAPEYVAEDLLQGEGFTEVRYVRKETLSEVAKALTTGEVDLTLLFSPPFLLRLEAGDPLVLLAEGTIDALLAFPPFAQELRAQQIAHVVVDSSKDRPWSQYFCCMVVSHREFVRKHPVATKRAMRAILKAADLCAREPERVAQP
jgi:ABC-type nitrate/sulfonate/bicarbonate transport system substrate-binding protein